MILNFIKSLFSKEVDTLNEPENIAISEQILVNSRYNNKFSKHDKALHFYQIYERNIHLNNIRKDARFNLDNQYRTVRVMFFDDCGFKMKIMCDNDEVLSSRVETVADVHRIFDEFGITERLIPINEPLYSREIIKNIVADYRMENFYTESELKELLDNIYDDITNKHS